MLKLGKSHTNNLQAFFKSWKRHHSRRILDPSAYIRGAQPLLT